MRLARPIEIRVGIGYNIAVSYRYYLFLPMIGVGNAGVRVLGNACIALCRRKRIEVAAA
jgi:hypothetical protein